jgi:hypothetical protein
MASEYSRGAVMCISGQILTRIDPTSISELIHY